MAQFCTHCGTPETEGLSFCTNCGAPVGQPPARTYQRPLAPPPAAPLGGRPAQTVMTSGQIFSRIQMVVLGGFLAIVFGVLFLLGLAAYFGGNGDKSKAPTEAATKVTPAATREVPTQPVSSTTVAPPAPATAEEGNLTDAQMQKLLQRCQAKGVRTKVWQPMVDALGLASPHVVQMVYTERATQIRHAFQQETSDGGYVFAVTQGDSGDGSAYRTSAQQALIVAVKIQKSSAPVAIPRNEALSGLKSELAFWAAVADSL